MLHLLSVRESTASLSSSIWEYRTVQGRTYQASKSTEYWYVRLSSSQEHDDAVVDDAYFINRAPNDEKHIEAFDVAYGPLVMFPGDLVIFLQNSNRCCSQTSMAYDDAG